MTITYQETQKAKDIYLKALDNRLRPTTDPELATTEQLWGEVRQLCHTPWTGAEQWREDWRDVFCFLATTQSEQLFEYVRQSWQCNDIHTIPQLRDAFLERCVQFNIATMRDNNLSPMLAPATLEQIQTIESEFSIQIPQRIRQFALNISAGADTEGQESRLFDFTESQEYAVNYLGQAIFDEDEDTEGIPFLAEAIAYFEQHSDAHFLDVNRETKLNTQIIKKAQTCLLLFNWFKGDDDRADFTITQGPLAGHVIIFRGALYSDPNYHSTDIYKMTWGEWLFMRYHELCLGEDVWHGLPYSTNMDELNDIYANIPA